MSINEVKEEANNDDLDNFQVLTLSSQLFKVDHNETVHIVTIYGKII